MATNGEGTAHERPVPVEDWKNWLAAQYAECSRDIRQVDTLLWQIPAAVGAIGSLVALAVGMQEQKASSGSPAPDWSIIAVVGIALLMTIALTAGMHKNRLFQRQRSQYRLVLHIAYLNAARQPAGALVSPVLPDPKDIDGIHVDSLGLKGIFPITSKLDHPPVPGVMNTALWNMSAADVLATMCALVLFSEGLLFVVFVVRALLP